MTDLALFTPTFRRDFEVFETLCASIDRLMPDVPHYFAVSRIDRDLFAPLVREGRQMIIAEKVMPEFVRVTGPKKRNYWLSPYRLKPFTGWYVQQFLKFAVVAGLPHKAVLVTDSDTEFVRAVRPETLFKDGRARLVAPPSRQIFGYDRDWAAAASRVLGTPLQTDPDRNYVESLIVWRPEVVQALLDHVSKHNRTSWKRAFAREKAMSEYCYYGHFAAHVPGPHQDLLFEDPNLLCHTLHYDFGQNGAPTEDAFIASLKPQHLAFGIQSNIKMTKARQSEVAARLRQAAAET